MKRYNITWTITGLLIAVLWAGCAQRNAVVKDTFLLNAQWEGSKAAASDETILSVQPFSIAPAFQGKGLVYRKGENQYESDYYNEYFISPASMISNQTRNWLSDSGAFGQVLSPVSSMAPTHVLEGHIKQLVADVRDEAKQQAELELSFFLIEQNKRDRTIRYQKTYVATRSFEDDSASACITALNQCLSEILENLEQDLASNLSAK